jgi:hypothetical protein
MPKDGVCRWTWRKSIRPLSDGLVTIVVAQARPREKKEENSTARHDDEHAPVEKHHNRSRRMGHTSKRAVSENDENLKERMGAL